MRVKIGEDVVEVKRTHIYNKVIDVSENFVNLVNDSFSFRDNELSNLCALVLKSESDDFVEVLVVHESKTELLGIVNILLKQGYFDLEGYNAVFVTKEKWNEYFIE